MDSNESAIDRRDFIKTTSAAGLGLMAGSRSVAPLFAGTMRGSPNEKVVVAVIGVNGRGVVHAQNFAKFDELGSRLHLRRRLARGQQGDRGGETHAALTRHRR